MIKDLNIDELIKLADSGNDEAQVQLAYRYLNGKDIEKDLKKGYYYLQLSLEQDNAYAKNILGYLYDKGIYVEQDFDKALYYYRASAEQGNKVGQYNLGYHYAKGKILKQDASKAFYWYSKSAEQGYAAAQFKLATFYDNGIGIPVDNIKAAYWYQKAADQNHLDAKYYLGLMYAEGRGVIQNFAKAFDLFKVSADAGNIFAQTMVGIYYRFGVGTKVNKDEAFKWFSIAANRGLSQAQCFLGELYYLGDCVERDYNKAAYWYGLAAKQNNTDAQNHLGLIYEFGLGTDIDLDKAIYWYSKSASLGDKTGQYNLGSMYDFGKGVEVNFEKAAYWFQKAVEQNDPKAQCSLGTLYQFGKGVEKDINEAFNLYTLSANQGYSQAKVFLATLYQYGNGVNKDINMAIYWLKNAIDDGDSSAMCIYGTYFEFGLGVEKNYETALYWYQKASEKNNGLGQFYLALMYENGTGTGIDLNKAFYWCNESAKNGCVFAECHLGYMNEKGLGINKNLDKAFYWYQKAALKNDKSAQCNLGIMYENGISVPKDIDIAIYWYQKSSDQNHTHAQFLLAYNLIFNNRYAGRIEEIINLLKKASSKYAAQAYHVLGHIYENKRYGVQNLHIAYDYYKQALELGAYCLDAFNRVKKLIESQYLHLGTRKDIFISWNHNNKDVKDELVSFLEDKGLCTVWDSDGSGVGKINDIIESAIANSKAYILLLTGNAIESKWVSKEIGIIFDLVKVNKEIKNSIIPIILNYKVIDGKRVPFDTLKAINELNEDNPIRNILDLTSQFAVNGIDIDYYSLEKITKLAIEYRLKIEYRNTIKDKFTTFNAALTKIVDSSNISSNIISSTLSFNEGYINRPLYDINNLPLSVNEVLNYPISLIYGEGGTGKTLYLKNIVRQNFSANNYVFYLPCKDIVYDIENNLEFIEILKKESFDYYFKDEYKISLEGFSNLFTSNNKIIILIDALDEINTSVKLKLYDELNKFNNAYQDKTDLKIVITSRNSIDGENIASKLNKKVSLFNLRGLSDEDINKLFDNIYVQCNKELVVVDENNQNYIFNTEISKEQFFISLNHINSEIKKNPLLLSNLIYVYIVTRKMPNKQFDIIQKSSELLTNTLDNDRDIKFNYSDYIKGEKLNNLLGYLTFKRSKNSNESTIDIFKNYLIKKNLIVNDDNPLVVATEIYNYLVNRSIIIRDTVSHEIFRDYYTAVYIYNNYFKVDEDEDLGESYISFKENYEIKLNNMITKNLSNPELPWPSVATDLLTKLDFEIYNLDTKQVIDQDNLNYDVFNIFLTKTLKEKGYSEEAIKIIKSLASNELLYFTDFIKQYIN